MYYLSYSKKTNERPSLPHLISSAVGLLRQLPILLSQENMVLHQLQWCRCSAAAGRVQCRCRPGCHLGRQQQELLLMPLSSSLLLLPSLSVSAASLLHNHLSSTTFSCSCSFSPVSEKKSVSKCESQRVLTSRASSTGQLCSCPVYRLVSCAPH